MALINATFLLNTKNNKEQFVSNLPSNFQFAPGERLVTRQITEQEYDMLKNDKYKNIKLYRFIDDNIIDKTTPPKGLDYKIGLVSRLYEDPYINSIGFLERMDYYAKSSYSPATQSWNHTDLVVREEYMYTIDPGTKYVVARTKVISWYREDNTVHPDKKYMFKPYTMLEMEEEAIRRRSNLVSGIKIELAKFANVIVSQQFPDASARPDSNELVKAIAAPFNTPLRSYIDAGDKIGVFTALTKATDPFFSYTIPWFNQTVREFIITRLG